MVSNQDWKDGELVKSYRPSLGSQKKYEEKVFLSEATVSNKGDKHLDQDQVLNNSKAEMITYTQQQRVVVETILQQVHINEGHKQFSLRAATTGKKEMGQLSERETFKPGDLDGLSEKKHDEIIDSLLFTGEKRDKLIKEQMVPKGDQ